MNWRSAQKVSVSRRYPIVCKDELRLEIADCIALQDYVGVGTNGLNRFKQAIEALVPVLKNQLLPSSIIGKVSLYGKKSVNLPQVVEVSCSITQRSSHREMSPFFCCEYPAQLLANMIRLVIVDDVWEDLFEFPSLQNMVVVTMELDKSGSKLFVRVIANNEMHHFLSKPWLIFWNQ